MFKHVLLPTDGSFTYKTEMLEDTKTEFAKDSKAHAAQYLSVIETAAKAAGVKRDAASATHDHPYEAIIKVATQRGCDLIVMASHGRKGMQGVLLGSETQKVLTHSHIPVLVCRQQ